MTAIRGTLFFSLALLLIEIASVQSQLPAGYVRASAADSLPGSRQLSFATDGGGNGASFASDRQLDIGSPGANSADGLDKSAKAVLNSRGSAGGGGGQFPANWPVPPPLPRRANGEKPRTATKDAADKDARVGVEGKANPLPTQQPNDLPTFVPRTLPPNNPRLLPVHQSPLLPVHRNDKEVGDPRALDSNGAGRKASRAEAGGGDDGFMLPPLPPGYTDAPARGDGSSESGSMRDQPRRKTADVSPSEIKDGQSLALYMLANQYRRGGGGGGGAREGGEH